MKRRNKVFGRGMALVLLLLLVTTMLPGTLLTAGAATVTKNEKTYDIAVVFDNSGSMYDNESWCRAKYAMEIFASMLNYDKDKLHIFPMWGVTTDGSQPATGGSYGAIEISSKNDIDKISNLYTVSPSNTPFAPITEAHDYLRSSNADEKWLVILTDGAFNQETRGQGASIDLDSRVPALASPEIKVQYLGFGKATKLEADEANYFYAKHSTGAGLKDDLVDICNLIFQRSVLPKNRLSGTALTLDLSMKNVIVFAQGANATITSLKTADGKEIGTTLNSGQRKYSEITAGGSYRNAPVDRTLAGQVVTFAACAKGEYILDVSGAESVQIFYEPDVDIQVALTNSDGQEVTNPDEFVAGEYTVTSRIVDGTTGEDVTSHELMGNNVQLKTLVKTSKDAQAKEYANGSKIVFEADEKTDIVIEGEYLGKYKISSKDDPNLAWLNGLGIKEASLKLKVNATVQQSGSWYKLSDHDNWQPVRVDLTADGQPLTAEQMAKLDLTVETSGNLNLRTEALTDQSAYNLYIGQDDSGSYVEPATGKYTIKATAKYTDTFSGEITASDSCKLDIQWYSAFWRWLLWVLIALVIIFLINMFLNHPVLPSAIYLKTKKACTRIKMNGTRVALSSDLYMGEISCEAKACTPFKNRAKPTAAFEVRNVRPLGSVTWYDLDGMKFKKTNGKYVNADNETIEEVKPKVRVTDGTSLKWNTAAHGTVSATIYINHQN